jgi:cytochrome c biogenesis protein CcmG/thiol:disulfide interchange protein DsbE
VLDPPDPRHDRDARRPVAGLATPRRPILLALAVALATTVGVLLFANQGTGGPVRGQPAPDLVGTTLDGAELRLSEFRGRPVVVNFWGPSCIPCRDEFPLMLAKLDEHAADGLAIVGVLTEDPPETARAFVADFGATWPTVVDPDRAIKTGWRVVARPTSFFIDRGGVLRSVQIGAFREADFERQYAEIRG